MAIFGWTRPDYTREANKKLVAAEAIGGLVRAETENIYSLTAILGDGPCLKPELYQSFKFRLGVDEIFRDFRNINDLSGR